MPSLWLRRRAALGGALALLAAPALAGQTVLRIGDQKGGAQPLMQATGVVDRYLRGVRSPS